jgi:hypothetical protein
LEGEEEAVSEELCKKFSALNDGCTVRTEKIPTKCCEGDKKQAAVNSEQSN